MSIDQRKTLVSLRKKMNLTQKDISSKLGITASYYGMIEQGTRTPSLTLAKNIASFFGKNIEEIFLNSNTTKCCIKS
ncbi:helix-turn-helix transcriptional regulator [Clostridium tyrobutyricum]|uniref:helix-turn-helix transcriptional regulator n=1 Tax=Clostridium tyrobutyricum TaxID=1519 RepID=UPI001C38ECEC|nr:helix-turn-helix transcriptional regulator [Clostridium tyrobutyricum]MBV4422790.1 helix-turn-helix transcriptional regulator [Clostridium tyrobutyricum]MBV4432687.1 helix-turn-helix transcriptional regulator [Clostridium tyrobutyricum]